MYPFYNIPNDTIYYVLDLPSPSGYQFLYSEKEMYRVFNDLCVGQKLRTIMVNIEGYEEMSLYETEDYTDYDFSYDGGEFLLVFEGFTVGLVIHAEGLFKYTVYPEISEVIRSKEIFGEKNANEYDYDTCYCNLANRMEIPQLGVEIKKCATKGCDYYPFYPYGVPEFDVSNFIDGELLPEMLTLYLSDDIYFDFLGDEIEYGHIYVHDHSE